VVHSVSLQSDIAYYWPGMNNTAFLVIFTDPCEHCRLYEEKKNIFMLSTLLSCKCNLIFPVFSVLWQIIISVPPLSCQVHLPVLFPPTG